MHSFMLHRMNIPTAPREAVLDVHCALEDGQQELDLPAGSHIYHKRG